METIYFVECYGGNYDDFYHRNIFATNDKNFAEKYVIKFNRLLKKWKEYYNQFINNDENFSDISTEIVVKYWHRYDQLDDIGGCRFYEVELRNPNTCIQLKLTSKKINQ